MWSFTASLPPSQPSTPTTLFVLMFNDLISVYDFKRDRNDNPSDDFNDSYIKNVDDVKSFEACSSKKYRNSRFNLEIDIF